ADRPDRLDVVAAGALERLKDRVRVRRDPRLRGWERRDQRDASHQPTSRCTTAGQSGTSSRTVWRPARPSFSATPWSERRRSMASAIDAAVGSATIPLTSWRTNSSGPPESEVATTGLLAANASRV